MSRTYEDVSVAKEWGLTPEEFWELSSENRATMIAHHRVSGTISSQEAEEARKDKGK